jgi:hypothetical protein
MRYLGMDVHGKATVFCLLDAAANTVETTRHGTALLAPSPAMITRLRFALIFVVVSSLGLAGCGSEDTGDGAGPGGVGCTEEARASVSVKVVDASGAPISDASVTFSVDGAAAQACENFSNGNYACGFEIAGEFIIGVSRGNESKLDKLTIGKTADGCHVDGKTITITLGA